VLVGSQATPSNLAIGRGSVAGANGLVYSGWGCVAVGENANAGGSNAYSFASTAVGTGATAGQNGIAIGTNSASGSCLSIAIGTNTTSVDGGIIIGSSNSSQVGSSGTFSVVLSDMVNYTWQEHKYDLLNIDGTIPTARLTKVNTTATLAVADWSSNTQTVTVSGVKADSVVFVSPAPASASDYASAGILCTAQATDSLTFTCTTTPTNAITVNVVCM
jgi:hypothetical protein